MIKLKNYCIYLIIILIISLFFQSFFQLSGWAIEGMEVPKASGMEKDKQNDLGILTQATPTDLFDDNQQLYNSFKSYNTAYSNYVKCVENTYTPGTTIPYDSSYNNSNGSIAFSSTTCSTTAQHLNTAYTDFIAKISKAKTTATDIQGGLTSIDDIKKNQNNNQILRSELDIKLQDLYSIHDSLPVINQTNVDSTTFAFMLWTVLASTMLLYVFTTSSTSS